MHAATAVLRIVAPPFVLGNLANEMQPVDVEYRNTDVSVGVKSVSLQKTAFTLIAQMLWAVCACHICP